MAIRNLLVAFNGSESSQSALRAGLLMQQKYDAHLTGLLAHDGQRDRFSSRPWIPDNVRTILASAIEEEEAQLEDRFRDVAGETVPGDKLHWITLSGEPDQTVAQYACLFDFTIVGQHGPDGPADVNMHPERIALKSGRPVLVIPKDLHDSSIQRRTVLAWDGRRAATRALNDAMQILETKDEVDIISIGDDIRPPLKGIDVVTALNRHGVAANRIRRPARSRNPGKDILDYCEEINAGWLVMGRFRAERFSGRDIRRHDEICAAQCLDSRLAVALNRGARMSRPNFLIITADQHRGDCLGVEGRRVRTPNLDRMAQSGARFTAAICPSPVCQPARASILTGQLCRTHGVHDNGIDLDTETGDRGFAGTLGAAGYDTALFGKAHFSSYDARQPTGRPESVLSSPDFGPDWNGPYMGFSHVELMLSGPSNHPPLTPPKGLHYERFFYADGDGEARCKAYLANGGDTRGAAQTWHSQLPTNWHYTPWTADRAIEWLKHGRDRQKPFCAWVSFVDPHHPFDCPEPWSRLHDPADVDLPAHRGRDLDRRPWWHRAALENTPQGNAAEVSVRSTYSRIGPQTDEQLREIIANTYGQIAFIDEQVGRLLTALAEAGVDDNTVVIYSSDHGDWLGDHGLILKGPMPYEGLLRVPLLMKGPGVPRGAVIDEPVSTLDIAATLHDLSGTVPGLPQHGQSLVPVYRGSEGRDFAMMEWELLPNRVGVALSLRTVRTRTAKLTVDLRSGAGEMYDLAADPDEMHNIVDDPADAAMRARLEDYLHRRPDDIGPNRVPVGPG